LGLPIGYWFYGHSKNSPELRFLTGSCSNKPALNFILVYNGW
jgi:hypothetical protein